MAMNRAQMLAILNSMNDESLLQAMAAVGIEAGVEGLELGEEVAEDMIPWSAKEIKVEPANKPQFIDKSKFIKQPPVVIRRPSYMPPEDIDPGIAEYITPEGTI